MNWEVVIGLETHAQLTTASKIFSGTSTTFGAAPNAQASAVDLALPGTLPVLNKGAVERAIRFGLAVGGRIAPRSTFERKNYFYPDLPKGYQISQFVEPVVSGGSLAIVVGNTEKTVRLTRAHLEEDAGKSLHEDFHGATGIDLNRAGTPLLEIVTEPDMRSAAEAVAYARALHSLVRWIGICDGNMQEGSFRCDANVSVRRPGEALGTRCEIKNLNSFRFLERAIEYEVRRQVEVTEDGGKVVQETRLFDPDRGETRPMRSKEDAHDYRYFPDPDLLPLEITESWVSSVRAAMPPLPAEMRARFGVYGFDPVQSHVLTVDLDYALHFDRFWGRLRQLTEGKSTVEEAVNSVNWLMVEMGAAMNRLGLPVTKLPAGPEALALLMARILDGTLSHSGGKIVFQEMMKGELTSEDAADILIAKLGLQQISDSGALESAVDTVIAAQPKLVEDYRAGKQKAFNALVGQVMKATQGKANPVQVNEILTRRLAAAG